jgi:hypothetical protein
MPIKRKGNVRFISKGKGKNRKVIPIRQKPYGEPRSRAARQIEELRKKGKRVRLIETNKRLELYAPYRSILDTKTGKIRLIRSREVPENLKGEHIPLKNLGDMKRADISTLLRSLGGHEVEIIPLPGGRFDVKAALKENEDRGQINEWFRDVEKVIQESRSKRRNRAHATSQFDVHATNSEEKGYVESVMRMLDESSSYRGLPDEQKRMVRSYVNVGLNQYFNEIENEEGAIGKSAEWDYMDAREFPVNEIQKEAMQPGRANRKATQVGELVQEWMNTEGGRPKF